MDLLLVSGARPILLEKTLKSFSSNVLSNFRLTNIFVNIDRFQGGEREVSQAEEIVLGFFPNAIIRKPEMPSFTSAVSWLWQSVRSPFCFHLEDDWIAETQISEDMVLPYFSTEVRQVSILTREKNWSPQVPFHCKWRRRKFLGLNFGREYLANEPVFTTSPSFLERDFARACGSMMDVSLDPEKQLYDGKNVELRNFTSKFRNRIISDSGKFLIKDIGRAFREESGLKKEIVDGKSSWVEN